MGNEVVTVVEDLDSQIEEALSVLTPRQRKFAEIFATGDNATSAALKAGYSPTTARRHASALMTKQVNAKVQHAVGLLRDKYSYDHGIPAAWKRKLLKGVAEVTADPEKEAFQPHVTVKAVRELNEMDGHHAPRQSHVTMQSVNVELSYQIDLQREKTVECDVESLGQPDKPLIEQGESEAKDE